MESGIEIEITSWTQPPETAGHCRRQSGCDHCLANDTVDDAARRAIGRTAADGDVLRKRLSRYRQYPLPPLRSSRGFTADLCRRHQSAADLVLANVCLRRESIATQHRAGRCRSVHRLDRQVVQFPMARGEPPISTWYSSGLILADPDGVIRFCDDGGDNVVRDNRWLQPRNVQTTFSALSCRHRGKAWLPPVLLPVACAGSSDPGRQLLLWWFCCSAWLRIDRSEEAEYVMRRRGPWGRPRTRSKFIAVILKALSGCYLRAERS